MVGVIGYEELEDLRFKFKFDDEEEDYDDDFDEDYDDFDEDDEDYEDDDDMSWRSADIKGAQRRFHDEDGLGSRNKKRKRAF